MGKYQLESLMSHPNMNIGIFACVTMEKEHQPLLNKNVYKCGSLTVSGATFLLV